MAFGGPRSSFVRPGAHSARRQDSCNDLTPCHMALHFISAGAHTPHSDETPSPTATRGSLHSARHLRSLAFLCSSDEELVHRLTSRDLKKSSPAAIEVMRRGDRLFEQLFALNNDQRYFTGRSLMDPTASMLLPVPNEDFEVPESKWDWVITVGVAALYLISAIYHGDIHFAMAPLLYPENPRSRLRGDAESDKPGNTKERVERARKAIDTWIQAWRKHGLDALRSQGYLPLSGSNLRWY